MVRCAGLAPSMEQAPRFLTPDPQPGNKGPIPGDVLIVQVVQQAPPLADHHQQPAARMEVFRVSAQVLREFRDARREKSDLNLGRARIALMRLVIRDDLVLLLRSQSHVGKASYAP